MEISRNSKFSERKKGRWIMDLHATGNMFKFYCRNKYLSTFIIVIRKYIPMRM